MSPGESHAAQTPGLRALWQAVLGRNQGENSLPYGLEAPEDLLQLYRACKAETLRQTWAEGMAHSGPHPLLQLRPLCFFLPSRWAVPGPRARMRLPSGLLVVFASLSESSGRVVFKNRLTGWVFLLLSFAQSALLLGTGKYIIKNKQKHWMA